MLVQILTWVDMLNIFKKCKKKIGMSDINSQDPASDSSICKKKNQGIALLVALKKKDNSSYG